MPEKSATSYITMKLNSPFQAKTPLPRFKPQVQLPAGDLKRQCLCAANDTERQYKGTVTERYLQAQKQPRPSWSDRKAQWTRHNWTPVESVSERGPDPALLYVLVGSWGQGKGTRFNMLHRASWPGKELCWKGDGSELR